MRITFLKTVTYKQNADQDSKGRPVAAAFGGPGGDRKDLYKFVTYEEGKTYDLVDNHAGRWLKRNVAERASPLAKVSPTPPNAGDDLVVQSGNQAAAAKDK